MPTLDHIADRLRHVFNGLRPEALVAGAIVAVEIGQQRLTIPYGTANLNTGQSFTEDTGFLLGSVTKILTTTALMRLVDRGAVDLDAPVIGYVPEFSLDDVDAAEKITVRMLVNHTSGIDIGGLAFNSGRGRDAYGAFIDFLPKVGVIFEPGTSVHYSNAGFVLAARMIERSTGLPFDRAIRREIFEPAGMADAALAHGQAVLRRTAVGAVVRAGVGLRATSLFSRPESNAAAGSTPVVTATDMLAFGRIHRRGGRAATGRQVLSRDLVDLMRVVTFDMEARHVPPVGLGWWLTPLAGTVVLNHNGGSPGGSTCFCVVPELDVTVISYVSGPGGPCLHDQLHGAVLEELTGHPVTAPLSASLPARSGDQIEGTYESFDKRLIVEVEDDDLVVTRRFIPYDDEQRLLYEATIGTSDTTTSTRYRRVGAAQFAPSTAEPGDLAGVFGRDLLLEKLAEGPGRRAGLQIGRTFYPRANQF